jgi:hypothetical protein
MTSNIEKKETETLTRPLTVLAPLIRTELEAGDEAGIEHYRKAGEMLLEAKDQCDHGSFTGWVERNFHLSIKTAQRYIKLVEVSKTTRASFLKKGATLSSLTDSGRAAGHKPTWQAPVQKVMDSVNARALAREREDQTRAQEARLVHTLGHQLIDIGYKALASKLHPDKGGSREAMARLNKVRAILKGAL